MTTPATRAKEIIQQCYGAVGSAGQLGFALDLLSCETSGAVFWPVVCEIWSSSDNTWDHQFELSLLMACHARTRRRYVPVEKQPLDGWPRRVTVWRGCTKERLYGLAWTLDKTVAEGFAHGHRNIRVPNPVLVSAEIPKTAIYFVENDRKESEVVLDPGRLRAVVIHDV